MAAALGGTAVLEAAASGAADSEAADLEPVDSGFGDAASVDAVLAGAGTATAITVAGGPIIIPIVTTDERHFFFEDCASGPHCSQAVWKTLGSALWRMLQGGLRPRQKALSSLGD
jgi:hypothetical protein